MKKMLIIIGLMAVVATVHGQDKKGKKQVQQAQQDRVYEVKFTQGGLNLLNTRIDSAVYRISTSSIPSNVGIKVVEVLISVKNLFNEEYQRAQKDTVKSK